MEEGSDAQLEEKQEQIPDEFSSENSHSEENKKKQYDELKDRFLRLAADFDNYKKRTDKDMAQRVRYAVESFSLDMFEVMDNFERALKVENLNLQEGLEQIHKLFCSVLERHGVRSFESVGKSFNPSEHDAIAYVPSNSENGIVIDEVCKGYLMNDKVIRCAKVAVSKGKENE